MSGPYCTALGNPCTPDWPTIATNGFDPQCDPAYCDASNPELPVPSDVGLNDPCATLAGDPVSYNNCEAALAEKRSLGTPGTPGPYLGATPGSTVLQNIFAQAPNLPNVSLPKIGAGVIVLGLIALAVFAAASGAASGLAARV